MVFANSKAPGARRSPRGAAVFDRGLGQIVTSRHLLCVLRWTFGARDA